MHLYTCTHTHAQTHTDFLHLPYCFTSLGIGSWCYPGHDIAILTHMTPHVPFSFLVVPHTTDSLFSVSINLGRKFHNCMRLERGMQNYATPWSCSVPSDFSSLRFQSKLPALPLSLSQAHQPTGGQAPQKSRWHCSTNVKATLCGLTTRGHTPGFSEVRKWYSLEIFQYLFGDLQQPLGHGPGHPALGIPVGAGDGPRRPRGPFQPQLLCDSMFSSSTALLGLIFHIWL